MAHRAYASLYERLVANTEEPANEQACWLWSAKRNSWWYGKFNLWVPGLQKRVTLFSHVAMYCYMESGARTADDLYLAYIEFKTSGLQVDHLCSHPSCVFYDHLEAVTPRENTARRGKRI